MSILNECFVSWYFYLVFSRRNYFLSLLHLDLLSSFLISLISHERQRGRERWINWARTSIFSHFWRRDIFHELNWRNHIFSFLLLFDNTSWTSKSKLINLSFNNSFKLVIHILLLLLRFLFWFSSLFLLRRNSLTEKSLLFHFQSLASELLGTESSAWRFAWFPWAVLHYVVARRFCLFSIPWNFCNTLDFFGFIKNRTCVTCVQILFKIFFPRTFTLNHSRGRNKLLALVLPQ